MSIQERVSPDDVTDPLLTLTLETGPRATWYIQKDVAYSGLISREEIFVDWVVKTFRGLIFKDNN